MHWTINKQYKTMQREKFHPEEHLELLWTSEQWQLCIWLSCAVSAKETMKWIAEVLWASFGILIYYTHV